MVHSRDLSIAHLTGQNQQLRYKMRQMSSKINSKSTPQKKKVAKQLDIGIEEEYKSCMQSQDGALQ